MKKILVHPVSVSLGCDPELFLMRDGKVIGSERLIPKEGLTVSLGYKRNEKGEYERNDKGEHVLEIIPVVVRDGVQVELHPFAANCRQEVCNQISRCFKYLKKAIDEEKKGILRTKTKATVSFDVTVEVSEKEMKALGPESRKLGCMPSESAYGEPSLNLAGTVPLVRSAGGHIHLGFDKSKLKDMDEAVKIFDIIVGNTCVLIDRDPGNVARRKMYGRAGEYRLPAHGLEYRVLSNFWLRSYPLASFVLSLSRFALAVAHNPDAAKQLLDMVDIEKVRLAINENDAELAQENFDAIKHTLSIMDYTSSSDGDFYYPLDYRHLEDFEYFVKRGIGYWFKRDPYTYWSEYHSSYVGGWENFISLTVAAERKQAEAKKELSVALTSTK